ncbi:hypothetical protein BDY19DRAFT_883607 [Irpex rosettiformis]|uniref:Uncharacterized protein n=1 Tax=Irpex rosettiformis TaxID=378272 RepID=A0ACB8UET9_9APHY|nr:hypothetical protein BDY19DRAFT_883607 [Irpex rosettiformis]
MPSLSKFYHPLIAGSDSGVTYFERMNCATSLWEPAGHVEWSSNHSANVYFGLERVPLRELRRLKKTTSKSRRFKANGTDYRWKLADNGFDLICVSTQISAFGRNVAEWSNERSTLRVVERFEPILDRLVVTCILNLWMKRTAAGW